MGDKRSYWVYKRNYSPVVPRQEGLNTGFVIIRPTLRSIGFAAQYMPFAVWYMFHCCGIFHNDCFKVIAKFEDNRMIHRTCVFPGFYKFPFMGSDDLQLGDIWTKEEYRGKGLASSAIEYAISLKEFKDTIFWYVVETSNTDSIRLAEKHGFTAWAAAEKKTRLGLSFIGKYEAFPTAPSM